MRFGRIVGLLFLLLLTWQNKPGAQEQVQAQGVEQAPIRLLPFSEVRLGPNGEGAEGILWLSWSQDQRLGFVRGYVQGYSTSWRLACLNASRLEPNVPDLFSRCWKEEGTWPKSYEYYRDLMTDFYTTYPSDRALPINRLFRKLLEPGMTSDKVHAWLDEITKEWQKQE